MIRRACAWPVLIPAAGALLALPLSVRGQTIDFETLPGGATPTDGMLLTDQFNVAPYDVTFELIGADPGTGPRIARVGPPETAFQGPNRQNECVTAPTEADMPAEGQNVGCFFLTDDGVNGPHAYGLRILYQQPVRQASGQLLDIEPCCESWRIRALGDQGQILAEVDLSWDDPDAGDGVATPWQFDLDQDIYSIELEYTGDVNHNVGLAFDNFSPAALPAASEAATWGKVKSLYH